MSIISSVIFYLFMGLTGCFFLKKSKLAEGGNFYNSKKYGNYLYLFWFLIWDVIVSYRVVTFSFGGTDAPNYIKFFLNCFSDKDIMLGNEGLIEHMGVVFTTLTKMIRSFTQNYHVWFMFFYGFIIFSYILFLNEFCPGNICFIPIALSFFPLALGFNTMRSAFSIAMILCGTVLLHRNYKKTSFIFFLSSCSVHKASIIYLLFYPYYFFSKKFNKNIWNSFFYFILMYLLGKLGQKILLSANLGIISSTYIWYIGKSLNSSLFAWMPVVLFPQYLLFLLMIIFRKDLAFDMANSPNKEKLKFLWHLCAFDVIAIPLCFITGNFRGYEYFYLARLMMWGEFMRIMKRKMPVYLWYLFYYVFFVICLVWFAFRLMNVESSKILPYHFAPFMIYAQEMNF